MLLLYESQTLPSIAHPGLQRLLIHRYQQCRSWDGFVLVEPGDSATALEQALGLCITTSLFGEVSYPDEDYAPSFEVIEDHGDSYEMVFITDDDTGSTVLFIPQQADMDADLLSLCQAFAVPATFLPENPIDPLVATLVDRLDENLREAFEERAGILEFEAGLPRAHAECLALLNVLVSHPESAQALFR